MTTPEDSTSGHTVSYVFTCSVCGRVERREADINVTPQEAKPEGWEWTDYGVGGAWYCPDHWSPTVPSGLPRDESD